MWFGSKNMKYLTLFFGISLSLFAEKHAIKKEILKNNFNVSHYFLNNKGDREIIPRFKNKHDWEYFQKLKYLEKLSLEKGYYEKKSAPRKQNTAVIKDLYLGMPMIDALGAMLHRGTKRVNVSVYHEGRKWDQAVRNSENSLGSIFRIQAYSRRVTLVDSQAFRVPINYKEYFESFSEDVEQADFSFNKKGFDWPRLLDGKMDEIRIEGNYLNNLIPCGFRDFLGFEEHFLRGFNLNRIFTTKYNQSLTKSFWNDFILFTGVNVEQGYIAQISYGDSDTPRSLKLLNTDQLPSLDIKKGAKAFD
tara:strand:+ start:329 stop:1240 length:912 start_codon:yes stop_codon:yes gene_type:complete